MTSKDTETLAALAASCGNEQIAEIYNEARFGGRAVVHPDDLHTLDSPEASAYSGLKECLSFLGRGEVARLWKHGDDAEILVVENLLHQRSDLPVWLRNKEEAMLTAQWKQQCKALGISPDGSDKKAESIRLVPVAFQVLYYGNKPREAPTTLAEMLVKSGMPKRSPDADPDVHLVWRIPGGASV